MYIFHVDNVHDTCTVLPNAKSRVAEEMTMTKIIYRGFEIDRLLSPDGWKISKNGEALHTADSEDAACAWIDAKKRSERAA